MRRVIAVFAGLVAVVVGGAPTGLLLVDAALRFGLVTSAVILGARAKRWVVLGSALVAAIAAGTSDVLPAALLALGGAIGLAATTRRSPVGSAIVVGVLANVCLLLPDDGRVPAVVLGSAVLIPVMVSGFARSRRHVRRQILRGVAVGGGVAGVFALVGVAGGLIAARPLLDGVSGANEGLAAARESDTVAARAALDRSVADFRDARSAVDAWWARPGRLVPVLGPHLRMASAVAEAGEAVAVAGADVSAVADLRKVEVNGGRLDLDEIRRLEPPLKASVVALDDGRRTLRAARSPWLLPALDRRVDEELERLDDVHAEAALLTAVAERLPGLLGGDGDRRYFLAVQTPVELRGSGGLIGNFGEIAAVGGKLELQRFGRVGELNDGARANGAELVAPEDYIRRYAAFAPQVTWQNVTLSPHFPHVVEVVDALYPKSGGTEIDGVVSVDPTALAAILRLTGPVQVPSWPVPITADNAEHLLYYDQYLALETDERIDFLGDVAQEVVRKLTTSDLPSPTRMIETLAPAVRGRHLLLGSADPAERRLFARIGADGALSPRAGNDYLAVFEQNAGGNKIDWFLRRHTTYHVAMDEAGALRAEVTIRLLNEAPTAGLPDSLIGNIVNPPDPRGTNRTILSVYTPWALQSVTVDGAATTAALEREVGLNVATLQLAVPPGETVVRLTLRGHVDPDAAYALTVQPQAMVEPELVTVRASGVTRDGPLVALERLGGL